MRSVIGREMRKLFASEFSQRFPYFLRVKKSNSGADTRWVYDAAVDLHFFFKVDAFPMYDKFVVEVGWTEKDVIEYRDNYQLTVNIHSRNWGTRLSHLWHDSRN